MMQTLELHLRQGQSRMIPIGKSHVSIMKNKKHHLRSGSTVWNENNRKGNGRRGLQKGKEKTPKSYQDRNSCTAVIPVLHLSLNGNWNSINLENTMNRICLQTLPCQRNFLQVVKNNFSTWVTWVNDKFLTFQVTNSKMNNRDLSFDYFYHKKQFDHKKESWLNGCQHW